MIFSVLRHNFVSNGWNFLKLLLNIYDQCVVMHVKFHEGVIIEELLPFDSPYFKDIFDP